MYYYCSHMTDTFLLCLLFLFTYDLADLLPVCYCGSVLAPYCFLTHYDSVLYADSQ